MTLAASLDLGTNTFRLLIADISPAGTLAPLRAERIITRLGEGFHRSGCINKEACERSIRALSFFARILNEYRVSRLYPVATSVVRDAVNGRDFIDEVVRTTGITLRVLTGTEEALLTHAGVVSAIAAPPQCLVIDIGGGSTELIISRDGVPVKTASIRLGVVHLAEKLMRADPPKDHELLSLKTVIRNELAARLPENFSLQHPSSAPLRNATPLVGTAGSITTLAAIDQALEHYDPGKINSYLLSRDRVTGIYGELITMNGDTRRTIPGMERGREDLIIPGTLMLLEIMNHFESDVITVSDGGLLEGILIDAHRSRKLC